MTEQTGSQDELGDLEGDIDMDEIQAWFVLDSVTTASNEKNKKVPTASGAGEGKHTLPASAKTESLETKAVSSTDTNSEKNTETESEMSDIATILQTSDNGEKSPKKNDGSTKHGAAKSVSESQKHTPSNIKTKPAQNKGEKSTIGTKLEASDIASLLSSSNVNETREKISTKKPVVVLKRLTATPSGVKTMPVSSQEVTRTPNSKFSSQTSSKTDMSEKMESSRKPSTSFNSPKAANTKDKSKGSSVGDIADVFDSIDSLSSSKRNTGGKLKSPAASKPETSPLTKSAAKITEINKKNESKGQKEDTTVLQESQGQLQKKDKNGTAIEETGLTEKESKEVDDRIAKQMFSAIKNCQMPPSGERYLVFFSPIELNDLATASVQRLIQTHPHIAFCFSRQASKFKKKKGYGQLLMTQNADVRQFLREIMCLFLEEKEIEIRIEGAFTRNRSFTGSFKVNKAKDNLLRKLINSGKVPPGRAVSQSQKKLHYFLVEDMPAAAILVHCKALFPFCSYVRFEGIEDRKSQGSEKSFYKAVKVFYNDETWMKAVAECCSDFTFDKQPLTFKTVSFDEEDEKKAGTNKSKVELEKVVEPETMKEEKNTSKSSIEEPANESMETANESMEADDSTDNDMVSSLTRDLCSDVMESLNKLKQLESDNPNVQKIIQMHAELAKLQESITKKDSTNSADPGEEDSPTTSTLPISELGEGNKSKPTKDAEAKKPLSEMEMVEKLLEEEAEKEQRQAEKLQKMREEQKEMVEKRKSTWAKKLLAESKDASGKKTAVNDSVKEMAQKMLKAKEEKSMSEKEKQRAQQEEEERKKIEAQRLEEQRVKEEEENQRKEKEQKEEEERNRKVQEEERRKEEERQRKEKELKAQQQLREELERAEAAQKQASTSSSGGFDPVAILQTFQSLSQTLPKVSDRRFSQEGKAGHDQADSSQTSLGKRDPEKAGLDDSSEDSKCQKLQEEPPVVMQEREYRAKFGILPAEHRPKNIQAQVAFHKSRRCPLETCRTNKSFVTESSFSEHWTTFHTQTMTVKFCTKCTAYFSQGSDLENHLQKLHAISGQPTINKMVTDARVKVVTNPSYQDPWPYTYTVV